MHETHRLTSILPTFTDAHPRRHGGAASIPRTFSTILHYSTMETETQRLSRYQGPPEVIVERDAFFSQPLSIERQSTFRAALWYPGPRSETSLCQPLCKY